MQLFSGSVSADAALQAHAAARHQMCKYFQVPFPLTLHFKPMLHRGIQIVIQNVPLL
jgi:hypothetical protein